MQLIFILWKIYKCLLHQIAREIMLLPVNNVLEKTLQKVRTEKIWKHVHTIWNLNLFYNFSLMLQRMHSFSASQKHIIFSCTLLPSLSSGKFLGYIMVFMLVFLFRQQYLWYISFQHSPIPNRHIVATWSERGKVHIWDISQQVISVDNPSISAEASHSKDIKALFTFDGHQVSLTEDLFIIINYTILWVAFD